MLDYIILLYNNTTFCITGAKLVLKLLQTRDTKPARCSSPPQMLNITQVKAVHTNKEFTVLS